METDAMGANRSIVPKNKDKKWTPNAGSTTPPEWFDLGFANWFILARYTRTNSNGPAHPWAFSTQVQIRYLGLGIFRWKLKQVLLDIGN